MMKREDNKQNTLSSTTTIYYGVKGIGKQPYSLISCVLIYPIKRPYRATEKTQRYSVQ